MKSLLIAISLPCLLVFSFQPAPSGLTRHAWPRTIIKAATTTATTQLNAGGGGVDESVDQQQVLIDEMKQFIESLSLEEDDQSRRDRLTSTFSEKFNDLVFCDLFDQQLIVLGDEAKMRAAERAEKQLKQQQEQAVTASPSSDDEASTTRDKSPEEKQLWALVDMMIQSKTMVKKFKEQLQEAQSQIE
eukprot:CAMPEP_0198145122 /NCGR_PEP_ID=MMETSP1443-20131203/21056_1 /TAXON_ID=186043 /ORGANISM="Entomoneis sp., Strain CCMP2396" /LENGTH=187 /DNA_ID=CAMNT_0043808653 /DNA_START=87 /DNA_END=650 /DNA_ORIENTATION=+